MKVTGVDPFVSLKAYDCRGSARVTCDDRDGSTSVKTAEWHGGMRACHRARGQTTADGSGMSLFAA